MVYTLLILHIAKSAGIRKLLLFIQNIILYLPVQFCGLILSTKTKKENSVWLSNKSIWTCCWTQLFAFRDTVSNECYILSIVDIFRVYLSEKHVTGTIGISHQRCRNMGRSKPTNSEIKWCSRVSSNAKSPCQSSPREGTFTVLKYEKFEIYKFNKYKLFISHY